MQQEPFRSRLDAHLHLQTIPDDSVITNSGGSAILKSFLRDGSKYICNGTSPSDWNHLSVISEFYCHELVPYFGAHPWYVNDLSADWLEILHGYIVKHSSGLGEIGLDKAFASGYVYNTSTGNIYCSAGFVSVSGTSCGNTLCTGMGFIAGDIFRDTRCPLSKQVRKRLRNRGVGRGISCVYSTEQVDFRYIDPEDETAGEDLYERGLKRRVLGSLPTLPGIFGLILANMAYKKLINPDFSS